ncbi:tellurite resistance TerB family protein [Rheinheimera sp. 1928-s]|uniref:tellurite resistance TerB family protein n=1 Tax=Rheinheimera sp. 1928-s TaxID=3033803 RepID=UPI002637CC5D|nr:tellurite resistance TerB family protein [Rheinheimera sp. 1928-s]MDF3124548.1 tellurite resistance TerB family protein [Rheinheimera sp. 1928-s]
MNTKALLEQLLKAGSDVMQQKTSGTMGSKTADLSSVSKLMSGFGGGALSGGALALLLGSKQGRSLGGKVITYGGLAALGVLAYKAYGNWQQQNKGTVDQHEPQTVDRLPAAEAEQHSNAILKALIGAAKADGHIDQQERELIDSEIAKLTSDLSLQRWFDQEMAKPLDPADIALAATTEEMAAEMYLASLLVINEQNYMEGAYLQELARQLKLPVELKAELDFQAKQALSQ